jgi:hypothetical protein
MSPARRRLARGFAAWTINDLVLVVSTITGSGGVR